MTDLLAAITLRAPRPGDLGWVVSRHGALYAEEYGWNMEFEVLVARVAADFFAANDPMCERCWIAERETPAGPERIGSVFLVRHPERAGVAKLRMLLIDPSARGLGLGKRLVDECTTFARAAGYHTITLWTNSILTTARAIYQRAGYRLVHAAPEPNFGKDLVGETWELTL
jgi:GNAT superfamily N-acetyltransferase